MKPLNLGNVTHVLVAGHRLAVQRRFNDTGTVLVHAPSDFVIPRTIKMDQMPVRAAGYPSQAIYRLNVAGLPLIRGKVT